MVDNRPAVLANYLFALGIFVTFPTTSEGFGQESSDGLLTYANFMVDEFSFLNITSLGTNLIEDENDCGYACLEIALCFSYNLAAIPDVNGKLLCELLPSDKYNNSDKFGPSKIFHHFSIWSPCGSSPCKNNGRCVSLYEENGYKCVCKEGFIGQNCETDKDECESSPCLNNGTCTDRVNGFNCSCAPGFAGNRCQIDINECKSSPCLNNGTCTDRVNGFNCSCAPGFAGNRCEADKNECESSPCLNNGTCTDRVNGFNCSCAPGFAGNRCEIDINECKSSPCLNNATCTDRVNGFNCSCAPGFAGNRCESDINECESSPCLNNGTCTDRVNGFNCNCPPGFAGNRCETDVSINSTVLAQFLAPAIGNDSKWLLCYRASTHGWAASAFHNRCDGKRDTVTIITNGMYVFGGYTDISWESSGNYARTSNAFIFSLCNKEGLAPFKSNVTNPTLAIARDSGRGPTFGNGFDIHIGDNANTNTNSFTNFGTAYSVPSGVKDRLTILAGTYHFSPDEVEVLYLG